MFKNKILNKITEELPPNPTKMWAVMLFKLIDEQGDRTDEEYINDIRAFFKETE